MSDDDRTLSGRRPITGRQPKLDLLDHCVINHASSRQCERGTRSCVTAHEPAPIIPGRSRRCQIIVRGGRDILGDPAPNTANPPVSRGQDIQVIARGEDGQIFRLPATGLILRVDGRKAVATVNLIVDAVELTAIEIVEDIGFVPKSSKGHDYGGGDCCEECREPVDPEVVISRTPTKETEPLSPRTVTKDTDRIVKFCCFVDENGVMCAVTATHLVGGSPSCETHVADMNTGDQDVMEIKR